MRSVEAQRSAPRRDQMPGPRSLRDMAQVATRTAGIASLHLGEALTKRPKTFKDM